MPILLPKGARVLQLLQRFIEDEEQARDYLIVRTPLMTKSDLYKKLGYLPYFKDHMLFINGDKEEMVLKSATCPLHFSVYNAQIHSYKDLPIRYSETSTLFRNAASGEMHGLARLRQFTAPDGHVICREDQVIDEFKEILDLVNYTIKTLGMDKDAIYTFSTWDENNKEKYIGNPYLWENMQNLLLDVLKELKIDFTIMEGKAPFYGPKFDVNFKNTYGKQERIITIHLDFCLSKMCGMTYVDTNNEKKHPLIWHRVSIGSYEKTLAMLLEKYDGAMPTWLSPTQVKVLTISEKYINSANAIIEKLKKQQIRIEKDFSNEKLSYKVRKAQFEKIPYIMIVGEEERKMALFLSKVDLDLKKEARK